MSDLTELLEAWCVFGVFDTNGNFIEDATPDVRALLDRVERYEAALRDVNALCDYPDCESPTCRIVRDALNPPEEK